MLPINSNLNSAESLVSFHDARSTLYLSIHSLLTQPITSKLLGINKEQIEFALPAIGTPKVWLDLVIALDGAGGTLNGQRRGLLSPDALECDMGSDSVCKEAFEAVGVEHGRKPTDLVRVVGVLARDTAAALARNDYSHASRLVDLQSRVLRQRSDACLHTLSEMLVNSRAPLLARIGNALESIIEHDFRHLGGSSTGPELDG